MNKHIKLSRFIASLLLAFGVGLSSTSFAAPVDASPISNTANQVAFGWWWGGCQSNHYRDATYWTEWRPYTETTVRCQKSCLVRQWDGAVVRCVKRCR